VTHDDAQAALLAGAASGVISRNNTGCYAFAHDLMAESTLTAGSPTERAGLHARATELLLAGASTHVDRAAAAAHHHLALARLRGDTVSITAAGATCQLAAGMLVERFAYEAAARLLAESIELHDRGGVPVAPDMLLGVARAELAAGNLRGARPWFWRAADHADTPARLAQAALGLGGIWVDEHRNAIDHASFMALIERALDGLDAATAAGGPAADRPDLRARLEVRRAAEKVYLGLASPSKVADAVARARVVGDPLVLAEVLSLQMHTMLGPASSMGRQALAEEIVEAATTAGDEVLAVMGVLWRTVHRILIGDPRAERSLNELRERADALQIAAVLFVIAAIDVMRLLRKGMIVEAELAVQECFELGTSIGDADAVGYYGAHLMNIRWLQGDAAGILPLAREVANSPTLVEGDLTYLAAVAALAAMAGEHDEAREYLRRVVDGPVLQASATSSNWMIWMFCIVESASRLGDVDIARRTYDMVLPYRHQPIVGSLGVACFGSAERTLGIAARTFGEADLAIEHLQRAIDANHRLGNEVLAAITTGELGCALTDRATGSDRARGRVLIESAIAILTEMGLPGRAEPLRAFAEANSSEPTGRVQMVDGVWHLSFLDDDVELPDSIGVRRLVQLLERPFVDVPVGDLVGGLDQATRQELMDSVALRSYHDRVVELRDEINEAEDNNDFIRAERSRSELDSLLEHIAASAALGQRSRQFTNSQERARVAVRKSLSRVFDDVSLQSPRLGGLLLQCIRTGNICRFEPQDPLPAVWQRS
jgi:tetratricopeptide (TPR) repeat protein